MPSEESPHARPETSGTVTRVPWPSVTGAQLEELLHGLLEAMGASSLTWRAGSVSGVTASDGGRDLDAVLDRPSPDGELDRQRWWVECKGRSETVERSAVQNAVLDASANTDVDVLVVATNSRFSNPTRDWVSERTRSFPRPVVKLWDRDRLDRLVRQYPTVVARVLPQALPDEDRLRLLVARFEELGEEPTLLDLEFFWGRQNWLMEQESEPPSRAIAMFLYTEGVSFPRARQWWKVLQSADIPAALITALINLPNRLFSALPRPLEQIRMLASAGRITTACLALMPAIDELVLNPWSIVSGGEDVSDNTEVLQAWQTDILRPILAFVQSDLIDACSRDCTRVTADNPHEIESLSASNFWKAMFEVGMESDDRVIVVESTGEPCTVGLNVESGCPLIISNSDLSCEQIVRSLAEILQFRKANPDDTAAEGSFRQEKGPMRLTLLGRHATSWNFARVDPNETDSA